MRQRSSSSAVRASSRPWRRGRTPPPPTSSRRRARGQVDVDACASRRAPVEQDGLLRQPGETARRRATVSCTRDIGVGPERAIDLLGRRGGDRRRAPSARPSTSRLKRSPPAMPPAVLTQHRFEIVAPADRESARAASLARRRGARRVVPSGPRRRSAIRPAARLAAKTSRSRQARLIIGLGSSVTIHKRQTRGAASASSRSRGVPAYDDRAAIHHDEAVAELAGEIEILLDQHDRHVAELAQVGDGAADILDDRGLDAFGRLVEQQQRAAASPARGRSRAAAAGRPTGRRRAGAACRCSTGNSVEHVVGDVALRRACSGAKPVSQILLDRQQRKDLAALRHVGDAAPRALVGRQRGDVVAVPARSCRG